MIQRELDARRDGDKRRREIFRTIWATRGFPGRLQYGHVQALNVIGIEFEGDSTVIEAWKEYLGMLNEREPTDEAVKQQFYRERDQKFMTLVYTMSKALRYKLTRLEIEKLYYAPIAHGTWAEQETVLREGVTRLFKGETSLPVRLFDNQSGE
jgi:hypothetical protein